MKIFYFMTLILMNFLLSGCVGNSDYQLLQTAKPSEKRNLTAASIEYKILPQDRLKVVLYRDPRDLSAENSQKLGDDINPEGILVNTEGYIDLPLANKVKVAGLTQTQAADRIRSLYSVELTDPSVYVEILNKRLFVLGEVHQQGVVKIDKEKMTLFEAIAFSGGLTDSAVRDNIVIVSHSIQNGMQMRKVDLTNFDTMQYSSLMLRPNDIVYVQSNNWKEFKVASSDYTSPFVTIAQFAAPFVTLKFLSN
jgi:polysaccharide export outer membrane protein